MRFYSLFGLTILATSLVACATGSKFGGSGGGEGGSGGAGEGASSTTSSTAGSGGGGDGGGATTTSTASTSGTTSTTSTTPPCEDSPCKLVSPQCGCEDGDMCAINGSGDRTCHKPGLLALDEVCVGLYACAAGALCVNASTTKSLCAPYCDEDSQCGGGLCVLELNDPDDPSQVLPDIKLCSNHCDPVSGSGCPSVPGIGCHIYREPDGQMRPFTLCAGAGTNTQNAACVDNEDCAPGLACFSFDDGSTACLQYCNVDNPACGLCAELNPPFIYNGVNYGACL